MILNDTQEYEKVTLHSGMRLALLSAQAVSRRASIGWSIVGRDGEVLSHGATMAGVEGHQLCSEIQMNSKQIYHVFLTMEPVAGFMNTVELIKSIEQSTCEKISIAHKFVEEVADPNWRKWSPSSAEIEYTQFKNAAYQIAAGVISVRTKCKPWLTAVSATNYDHQSISIMELDKEFGAIAYLSSLTRENRVILYSPSQKELIGSLSQINNMDETLEFYEVSDSETCALLLKYFATERRCNALLFCDLSLLSELVDADLVDEIILHTLFSSSSTSVKTDVTLPILKDWDLISSSAVGSCNRVRLMKRGWILEKVLAN